MVNDPVLIEPNIISIAESFCVACSALNIISYHIAMLQQKILKQRYMKMACKKRQRHARRVDLSFEVKFYWSVGGCPATSGSLNFLICGGGLVALLYTLRRVDSQVRSNSAAMLLIVISRRQY